MKTERQRKIWHLKSADFDESNLYAGQDWRFQMYFEYLRISPSYLLATQCKNVEELIKRTGDEQHALLVWKTYRDFGNVYGALYRAWWKSTGINLFGTKTARPRVTQITQLNNAISIEDMADRSAQKLSDYVSKQHVKQGRRDCLVVSIPIGIKRVTALKQLKAILDAAEPMSSSVPASAYVLEKNKMQMRRFMIGLKLVYMKAAKPKEELWRLASRAKVSNTHRALNPTAEKKDANSAEARRMVTIMASRLLHDTHIIAENAARGVFPSMTASSTIPFDFATLRKRLVLMRREEERQKQELLDKSVVLHDN